MAIRQTKEYKQMTPYRACECAEGFGSGENATLKEVAASWQYLVDTGLCWQLQGWYGRNAVTLIENGIISKPKRRNP